MSEIRGAIPPVAASRKKRIAADERFLSRLYGQLIHSADAPGPDAFGGGWVKCP